MVLQPSVSSMSVCPSDTPPHFVEDEESSEEENAAIIKSSPVTLSQFHFATDVDLIDTADFFETRLPSVSSRDALPVMLLKVLLFVPWCALVGAAILFSPGSLDRLNSLYFSPSYMKDLTGARRLIHWVEYAPMFVFIFVGCMTLAAYYTPMDGAARLVTVMTGLALGCGRGAMTWISVSSGEKDMDDDVKADLYIAMKSYVSGDTEVAYNGMVIREWNLDDEL